MMYKKFMELSKPRLKKITLDYIPMMWSQFFWIMLYVIIFYANTDLIQ